MSLKDRRSRSGSQPRTADQVARNRFYQSARWRKFRDWYLRQHPLCVECEKRGFLVPAVHLDHITPLAKDPTRDLDETNVQGLCASCHTHKTVSERTGRKPGHWSDSACDADGMPRSPDHPWNRESGDGSAES